MNTEQFQKLLIDSNACQEARDWALGKSWEEVFTTCHRGDWLLWLFRKVNPNDLQQLTLAKGYCANTVRHLMKDERTIRAVDAAIAFGEGKINREELNAAYFSARFVGRAYVSAAAAYAAAAYAADAASAAAVSAASYAAASASAAAAYTAAAYAAKKANQQLTADICRQYLPIEIWNIK